MDRPTLSDGYRALRKFVILAVGLSVVLVGALMILLPGPAILVIPTGLAILALEFGWARRLLRALRQQSAILWAQPVPAEAPVGSPRAPESPDDATRP
jgi:uncharacterized protein (TIGR02611 family)